MKNNPLINTDRIPLRQGHNGVWQLRKRVKNGKRIEVSLGTADRQIASERAQRIVGAHVRATLSEDWRAAVSMGMRRGGWLRRTHARMVTRSNLKGRPCLTIEQLEFIALRSGGQCEVSGIQFHLGANALHPFQPSVDRVNSDIGY